MTRHESGEAARSSKLSQLLFPAKFNCSFCKIIDYEVYLERGHLLSNIGSGGLGLKIFVARRQRGPTHNYKAII
jgi:hypothetical protein